VYLGEDKVRMFVGVVATAHAALNKPKELYSMSLQRARMCEVLVANSNLKAKSEQAFLTGMFSLLDALLDSSLDQLLALLPLQDEVQTALLHHQGQLGQVLALLDAYEQADWGKVSAYCTELGIPEALVASSYQQALDWTNNYEKLS
jgi:c-di-GMP-related signal transduction protein